MDYEYDIDPEDRITFVNGKGWVRLEFVNQALVPDDKLPFARGSLIRIKRSPRPDKIPDNAIAMFIDYGWRSFRVTNDNDLLLSGIYQHQTEPAITQFSEQTGVDSSATGEKVPSKIQYTMRVLFDESVVEFVDTNPPEKLGNNYIEITSKKQVTVIAGTIATSQNDSDPAG